MVYSLVKYEKVSNLAYFCVLIKPNHLKCSKTPVVVTPHVEIVEHDDLLRELVLVQRLDV